MTLEQLHSIGQELTLFLSLFADCFASIAGRRLLQVYVQGQLSDVPRKNCEAIALKMNEAPRTLQRFLESIQWDAFQLRDRSQEIIAADHAHEQAIGLVDESGTTKSGRQTAGVTRQYNGNRGKVENCIVGVHLGYSRPGFQTLIDSRLYLPENWAGDPQRREEAGIPEEVEFQTKPQIALTMIERAVQNGIRVAAWTFDEFYSRDRKFLDGLEAQSQAYVGEIPSDMQVWTARPRLIQPKKRTSGKGNQPNKIRVAATSKKSEVRQLLTHSSRFHQQTWQRYRIKETERGPEVWEVKWLVVWRSAADGLPSRRQTLIITRNVRTGEVKYFLSNRVVGQTGVTLRWLLRVAFGRWAIEACFRLAKEEPGFDHFEVRGWESIHRHWFVAGLSYLFCNRLRQTFDNDEGLLTVEQVRRSVNVYLSYQSFPARLRDELFEAELEEQQYYRNRSRQARESHTKTRIEWYRQMGIDVSKIKSCLTGAGNHQTS